MRAHLAPLVLASVVGAQVPDGSYVVSAFGETSRPGGGVFIVDPRTPGPPTVVTGLGQDLLGVPGQTQGANCVAVRPDDGALLVGEIASSPTEIELHEIRLAGSNAVVDNKIRVGTLAQGVSGNGLHAIALLTNGDALIGVHGLVNGPPLYGAKVAIVRRNGTVVGVPLTGTISGVANGIAVDRTETTGYVAILPPSRSYSTIYAFPLPAGGLATQLGTVVGAGAALAVDSAGRIVSTSFSPRGIVALDPTTGTLSLVGSTGSTPNGANLEAATDFAVYVLNGFHSPGLEVGWIDAGGTAHALTNALTGVGSGIAVLHDPRTYGVTTPGTFLYQWQVAPNPGGLPRVGNASFALQLTASGGGSAVGFLLAAVGSGDIPVLGFRLLLAPTSLVSLGPVPASGTIPMPVPSVAPIGVPVFFQTLHVDAGAPLGLAASNGLRLTLLP